MEQQEDYIIKDTFENNKVGWAVHLIRTADQNTVKEMARYFYFDNDNGVVNKMCDEISISSDEEIELFLKRFDFIR